MKETKFTYQNRRFSYLQDESGMIHQFKDESTQISVNIELEYSLQKCVRLLDEEINKITLVTTLN